MVKKFLTKCVTGVMAGMLLLSSGVAVYANNWTDTYHTAYLDETTGESEWYSPARYKEDTSKGYVKNISSSNGSSSAFALVGSDYDGSDNYYEDFRLFYTNVNPGDYAYLTNLVKESGYNYAAMKCESNYYGHYTTYFAWSPDNVDGY